MLVEIETVLNEKLGRLGFDHETIRTQSKYVERFILYSHRSWTRHITLVEIERRFVYEKT
jgi:hypothetical protein